jgi:hypothetical protein
MKDPITDAIKDGAELERRLHDVASPEVLALVSRIRGTLVNVHDYGWPKPADRSE